MQAEASNVFAFSDIFYFGFGKNKVVRGKRQSHKGTASSSACSFSLWHSFLYISSLYVKNNLLGVEQDSELKVGTKVPPFADTESVCVVTCQATDIT